MNRILFLVLSLAACTAGGDSTDTDAADTDTDSLGVPSAGLAVPVTAVLGASGQSGGSPRAGICQTGPDAFLFESPVANLCPFAPPDVTYSVYLTFLRTPGGYRIVAGNALGTDELIPVEFESITEGTIIEAEVDIAEPLPEGVPITLTTSAHMVVFELFETEVTITGFE